MAELIEIVEIHDTMGYPIGRRLKYRCDGCGGYALRSIRMGNKRVLCFECRQIYQKRKRLEYEANKEQEKAYGKSN